MTDHWSWLHLLIYRLAWPTYKCELCVGQDDWQGCYCAYHGAAAPGEGPTWWQEQLRRLWSVVARQGGYLDPAL